MLENGPFRPLVRPDAPIRARRRNFHLQNPSWRPPQAGGARGFARCSKKRRNGILTDEEARQALDFILGMPIKALPHSEFLPAALDVAMQTALSVYAALFLAIARVKSVKLFTADSRLARQAL